MTWTMSSFPPKLESRQVCITSPSSTYDQSRSPPAGSGSSSFNRSWSRVPDRQTDVWSLKVMFRLVAIAAWCWLTPVAGVPGAGTPCVFEGHLKTDRNWFGYLANVTVVTTARMTFEFTYAADRCCQTILFYTHEQTSIISARMNCWQKEYLLRPEDDQMLRLTPRFAWSGCHMTHPGGLPTYHCEGGRSFTVDQPGGLQSNAGAGQGPISVIGGSSSSSSGSSLHPSTWYVAVSNCAALQGLDLRYRLVVYGHVGDCPASAPAVSAAVQQTAAGFRSSQLVQGDGSSSETALGQGESEVAADVSCRLEGEINSTSNWYGFVANASLARGGGFRFQFRFPASMSNLGGGASGTVDSYQSALPRVVRVLLYSSEDAGKLNSEQTCWQRDGIIRQRNQPDQVIELSAHSSFSGCITTSSSGTGRRDVSCRGERRYDQPRRMYVAISDCRSTQGLHLNYQLEFFGFTNSVELCSSCSRNFPTMVTIFLLAGVVVIVIAVFKDCYTS